MQNRLELSIQKRLILLEVTMEKKDDEDEGEKHLRRIHLIAKYGPWLVVLASVITVTIMILTAYLSKK